ncbi:MAG TPA: hypothetical protein VK363_19220 [Pyrinomonadaceae bacterium]|nr:hypothetical protein [Pyrinomonadaceae bacterium]
MKDETLPNGTTFHWRELYSVPRNFPSGKKRQWYVPVTCGSGASPSCLGKRPALIIKSLTALTVLTPADTVLTGGALVGYCRFCFSLEYRANQALPDGSQILWLERDERGVPVVCGKCSTPQLLKCAPSLKVEDHRWPCSKCGEGIGEQKHLTGATILWLKRGRNSRVVSSSRKKQQNKTPFICARCGQESSAWTHTIRGGNWSGLCEGCRSERGHWRKQTQNQVLQTGSICLYSERHGTWLPVLCGLPVSEEKRCAEKNDFNKDGPLRENFSGYCPTHSRVEISTAIMKFGAALIAYEQAGIKQQKPQRKLNDVIDEVCALWLEEKKQLGAVTYEEVARRLQRSGKESKDIGAKAVAQRLNRAGYEGQRADVVMRVLREKRML